ncbi:S41 family peptidase [Rickettsia endosymbiont of Cardiosporidium cionae]|uniref:S41 family peptidase n=1 Tax=Rickettsia endosymbiont of Cardiosporidium cionae TaxID=2777155 RepID=UPI001E47C454|nr:S41 family peptidase [Rickettsia endosymbiont of Cardiosporidium cionae]KAF8818326.1 S41 family peptidase [Rickettsia endosymbiont of Cardiosporidium cionae]
MNNYTKYILSLIQQVLYIIFLSYSCLAGKDSQKIQKEYYYKQFQDIFEHIEENYVQIPNFQEMTDAAIDGMLLSLDPFSSYYVDEAKRDLNEMNEGKFGGIGVEIIPEGNVIRVISPIDDLPAYNAGIKAGDYIIAVDGVLVSDLGYTKSVRQIRGSEGTLVALEVLSIDTGKVRHVELKRSSVKIVPVKYDLEIDNNIAVAYIRISVFNANTIELIRGSFKEMQKKLLQENKKLSGIVLDLRNNPGGILEQAIYVAEYFIDNGVVVSTKTRNSKDAKVIYARKFLDKAPNVPVVLMINGGSASGSEIVAGALQDHKRAVIVGSKSFGKGTIQTVTSINSRAAVKLTTGKYYTPSGSSINGSGIIPDVVIPLPKEDQAVKASANTSTEESSILNSPEVNNYLTKYNKKKKNTTDATDNTLDQQSKRYKADYLYARSYDIIRALIVVNDQQTKQQ